MYGIGVGVYGVYLLFTWLNGDVVLCVRIAKCILSCGGSLAMQLSRKNRFYQKEQVFMGLNCRAICIVAALVSILHFCSIVKEMLSNVFVQKNKQDGCVPLLLLNIWTFHCRIERNYDVFLMR